MCIKKNVISFLLFSLLASLHVSAATPEAVSLDSIHSAFSTVHSQNLIDLPEGINDRASFLQAYYLGKWKTLPPIIGYSPFVSSSMVEHLMRNKKDAAIGVKYVSGQNDAITSMEGVMHTFVTPLCAITMTGDYRYANGHGILRFTRNQGRKVILSAAIHPDFEDESVFMKLVEVHSKSTEGVSLPKNYQIPTAAQKKKFSVCKAHDENLRQHMVYHLTCDHRIPSCLELCKMEDQPYSQEQAKKFLERLIRKPQTNIPKSIQNKFVTFETPLHTISLEVLLQSYIHQIQNEWGVLEASCPQGYVYTIDPPSIFAKAIGGNKGVEILNRLQALAMIHVQKTLPLQNLKIIGFNSFADPGMLDLLKSNVFTQNIVLTKAELFQGPNGGYSITADYALVLHNNSDAFGQNIETEGPTSMDGVIGSYSDAACILSRMRKDLLSKMIVANKAKY